MELEIKVELEIFLPTWHSIQLPNSPVKKLFCLHIFRFELLMHGKTGKEYSIDVGYIFFQNRYNKSIICICLQWPGTETQQAYIQLCKNLQTCDLNTKMATSLCIFSSSVYMSLSTAPHLLQYLVSLATLILYLQMCSDSLFLL